MRIRLISSSLACNGMPAETDKSLSLESRLEGRLQSNGISGLPIRLRPPAPSLNRPDSQASLALVIALASHKRV